MAQIDSAKYQHIYVVVEIWL